MSHASSIVSSMRAALLTLVVFLGALLGGCGEEQQHSARTYQGKPDTAAWDNPQFGGKQAEWERAIEARTQNQNEYSRTQ